MNETIIRKKYITKRLPA